MHAWLYDPGEALSILAFCGWENIVFQLLKTVDLPDF
jgi:hypothetical protein